MPRLLDDDAVKVLLTRARQEVDEGLLPSCQLALALDGELVAFDAYGEATTETRYSVFSCTKPIVAAALWILMGEGALDVGAPAAHLVPEFGTNGKHVVTVEQLLLHTAGFPRAVVGPPEWDTRRGRLAAFARWELEWEPGTRFEYHSSSAHWVLAEILERLAGTDYRDVVEDRVTRPAGLPRRVLGVPPGDQDGIAELELRGEPATPEELEAVTGIRDLPSTELSDDVLLIFNRPDVRAVGVPAGGGVMTTADLALFYQALLHDPEGIWDPAVLSDATGHVRNRFGDPLFGVPANRTLGLVVAGDDGLAFARGFGSSVSPRAFGHGGAGGQIGWADPATGLSFAYATNGIDGNVVRQFRRGLALSTAAGACASPEA